MDNNIVYMPTLRLRQQEILVLNSFDFGNNIYPLIEVVKEKDRKSNARPYEEIYNGIINNIRSNHVFVDLPTYLEYSGSVNKEIVEFGFKVINNLETRCEYILKLENKDKIIPVISSYVQKTGEVDTIRRQYDLLHSSFNKIAYRVFIHSFSHDMDEVEDLITDNDYLILDIDKLSPFRTPQLRPFIERLARLARGTKILLRSALSPDIENVKLSNDEVIIDADNSHIDIENLRVFGVNCCGDYAGIKKDKMTAGGTISPGFIYYDAVQNQYYGYKADIKDLNQFRDKIVPDIINSQATHRMLEANPPYVGDNNPGYKTILDIMAGTESGKSQAKFKKIAMDHYIYCIKTKIDIGELTQVNM
ncbi:beta family protein [Empedobacter falsenii]|uniref:beta family protein n=1 Tax=Empedobacter falsenii TaxID=343874 RepID=UPI003A7FF32E